MVRNTKQKKPTLLTLYLMDNSFWQQNKLHISFNFSEVIRVIIKTLRWWLRVEGRLLL